MYNKIVEGLFDEFAADIMALENKKRFGFCKVIACGADDDPIMVIIESYLIAGLTTGRQVDVFSVIRISSEDHSYGMMPMSRDSLYVAGAYTDEALAKSHADMVTKYLCESNVVATLIRDVQSQKNGEQIAEKIVDELNIVKEAIRERTGKTSKTQAIVNLVKYLMSRPL